MEKVLSKTVNNPEVALMRDYIKGNQWTVSGQITRNNFVMVETPVAWKSYNWNTHNVIQDAVQQMTSLVIWEYEEEYAIVSTTPEKQELFTKTKFAECYSELVEKLVKYWKAWVFLRRDFNKDTYTFDVISWYKITELDWKLYIVDKQDWKVWYSPDYKITEVYTDSETWSVVENTYFNLNLVSTMTYEKYPYFIFDVDKYVTRDLIRQQDIINVKYTIEKNVELYASDPLLALIWYTPEAWEKIKVGAWAVMKFDSKDTRVERIEGVSLPTNFIELKKLAITDFYRLAKLSAIKNSDLSGVTSWYWIQLKLTETLAYVNRFRNDIKTQLIEMFNRFFEVTELEELKIEKIYLAPIIWQKNNEIENEQLRLDVVKKKVEITKLLIEAWFTKEEAKQYIEENK